MLQDGQVQLVQKVDALMKFQEGHVRKSFVISKATTRQAKAIVKVAIDNVITLVGSAEP